jgi:hypothetical protein
MKLARHCRKRATELKEMAKDAPDLEEQLLHIADDWMTVARLREKFYAGMNQTDASQAVH